MNRRGILALMVSLMAIPVVKAQPYWTYWFAEAFGYGVHGGARSIDFIIFFALFTSLIYLAAKNLFGQKEEKSRAVIVLSVSLGLALTLALLSSTKFSLSLFYPFAKNLLFFLFAFLLYAFLIKYGGMEKNKVWAFIAAFIIAFLIFNVANCFVTEGGQGNSCTMNKFTSGLGKPFKSMSDWFKKTFSDGKKWAKDTVGGAGGDAKKLLDDVIPKREEERLKKQTCDDLIKQAKSPDALCSLNEVATDLVNMCTGDHKNPYSEITRWRIAMEKCQQEMNAEKDADKKAKIAKNYNLAKGYYTYLEAERAFQKEDYATAITKYDEIIMDKNADVGLQSEAVKKKKEAVDLKTEKDNAKKLKSANTKLEQGNILIKEAKTKTSDSNAYFSLYQKAIGNFMTSRKDARSIQSATTQATTTASAGGATK